MAAGVQLVGTVVGSYFGGPVGGAIGGAIGGLLGSALFPPPPIRGPRAEDIRFNNSNVGAPIKRLYGSGRTAPTLMWFGEREDVERKRTEGDLFGIGGQEIIEYEYYATFALALGEPADAAGVDVRRIWANGELIYSQNALSADQLEQLESYLALRQHGLEEGLFGNADPSGYIGSAAAAQKFEEEVLTIYRGTEDQTADPTIASYVGAENTPGYKGLAYVIFKRWDITRWGGALPTIEVEYVNGPTSSISAPEWRNEVLYPWQDSGATTPENCANLHEYSASNSTDWLSSMDAAIADFLANNNPATTKIDETSFTYPIGWSPDGLRLNVVYPEGIGERIQASVHYNRFPVEEAFGPLNHGGHSDSPCGAFQNADFVPDADRRFWWWVNIPDGSNANVRGLWRLSPGEDFASEGDFVLGSCTTDYPPVELYFPVVSLSQDAIIRVRRTPSCPESICDSRCAFPVPAFPADERYCVNPQTGEILFAGPYGRYEGGASFAILVDYTTLDAYEHYEEPAIPQGDDRYPGGDDAQAYWTRVWQEAGDRGLLPDGWEAWVYGEDYPTIVESPSFRVLQQYASDGTSVTRYPLNPCVPEWSQRYDDAAWWTAAYDAQRARYLDSGQVQDYVPPDLSFGAGFPVTQSWACARFPPDMRYKQALPITVRSIVEDISAECGLLPTQIDASALTKTLWGYERNAVMTGRDAIEQLRTYAFFDACESGTQVRFVVRGGAAVAALSADDLGAHVDGEQPPPAITPQRTNDVELARQVLINYLDVDSKYQGNTQQAGRVVVGEQNKLDMSLAIVAAAAVIKGVANAVLYDQWAARNRYSTALLREWLRLEPTDPIIVPVDEQMVRMRITQIDHDPRGVLKLQTVREEATVYTNAPDDVGVAFPVPDETHPYSGPTLLTVIDGPALTQADDDAGFFLAARGLGSNWDGALLYMSTDGTTFSPAMSLDEADVGNTVTALSPGPWLLWDRSSVLTVRVPPRVDLLSVTELQALGGGNRAFVGADQRWELIAFATATLVEDEAGYRTYELTDLLRGLQGTEWATTLHQAGDVFVMANTLTRVGAAVEAINVPLSFKAVTSGTSIDTTGAVAFTPRGVALKPYAPCAIDITQRQDGTEITWQRRTRISGEWLDFVDVPLNEESEQYDVEVYVNGALHTSTTVTERRLVVGALEQVAQLAPGISRAFVIDGVVYGVADSPYWAGLGSTSIRAFDASSYALLGGAALGLGNPMVTAFVRIGDVMYASAINFDSAVFRLTESNVLDSDPDALVRYNTSPGDAQGLAVVGSQLWAALRYSNLLVQLDPTALTSLGTIDTSGIGAPSAMSSDGTDLYVNVYNAGARLVRITTAGSVTWNVPTQTFATDVLFAGGKVWVLGSQTLGVYAAADGAELETWPTVSGPDESGIVNFGNAPADRIKYDGVHVIVAARLGGVMGYMKIDPATFATAFETYQGRYYAGVNGSDVLLTQGPPDAEFIRTGAFQSSDLEGQLRVDIYQLSAAVGRGYVGSKTA